MSVLPSSDLLAVYLLSLAYDYVNVNEYAVRNGILLELGFKNYRAYLRSPLWKRIRKAKITKDPRCWACEKPGRQIHHSVYSREVLLGDTDIGLWTLCARCHRYCEFTRAGHKRQPSETVAVLEFIRKTRIGRQDRRVDLRVAMIAKARRAIRRSLVCRF